MGGAYDLYCSWSPGDALLALASLRRSCAFHRYLQSMVQLLYLHWLQLLVLAPWISGHKSVRDWARRKCNLNRKSFFSTVFFTFRISQHHDLNNGMSSFCCLKATCSAWCHGVLMMLETLLWDSAPCCDDYFRFASYTFMLPVLFYFLLLDWLPGRPLRSTELTVMFIKAALDIFCLASWWIIMLEVSKGI